MAIGPYRFCPRNKAPRDWSIQKFICQDDGKGGVEFKGGSLHDGLAVLTVVAGLQSTLPSFYWSYKIQGQTGNRDGFGGYGGCGRLGRDGYPP